MKEGIRYLWFDLGYTLVKTDRERVYREVLAAFGVVRSLEEITLAYHRTDKLFMREYRGVLGKDGRFYMPWYIGCLNYMLGEALPIEEVMVVHREKVQAQTTHWAAFPFAKPTLRKLKESGFGIGLISNWNETARRVLAETGLEQELDHIVISSEAGCEKPDPAIFHIALRQAGVSASESLYIGDNYYDDVIGAERVGMNCLLINPYERKGIEELTHKHIIASIEEVPELLAFAGGIRTSNAAQS